MENNSFGVSPAFWVSLFSQHFTLEQVREGIKLLDRWGFQVLQLEVYHREQLGDWSGDGLYTIMEDLGERGMRISAFVAHFLIHLFTSERSMTDTLPMRDWVALCGKLQALPPTVPLVVPLGALQDGKSFSVSLRDLFIFTLKEYAAVARSFGRTVALEILPGSILSRIFHEHGEIPRELEALDIHLLYDTGHHFIADSSVTDILPWFKGRVAALHLCDNRGTENRSDIPGTGNIDWTFLLEKLDLYGYTGSYDLEILCPPALVETSYRQGRDFIIEKLKERVHHGV
ncbi:MAG: sugar phosphate isomerase/epimerase [Spirochaetales bacterium]|nr:sugar phosphate isomerase/epimerase [Spirochaetales bacterium]